MAQCCKPLLIEINGDVTMCCLYSVTGREKILLGNVYKDSLSDILTRYKTMKIVRAIQSMDVENMPAAFRECPTLIEEGAEPYLKYD